MSTRAQTALAMRRGTAVTAMAILTLIACSRAPTLTDQRERVLGELYAAYDARLEQLAPAFVVVTYPADLGSMSAAKRAEMRVVRDVLSDRQIPHDLARYDASVVTLINEKHWRHPEYQAYLVPEAAVDLCRNRTLLYLNLDVRDPVYTKLHPVAADNDIVVKVWNDPATLSPQFLRLWESGNDHASTP